MLLASYLTMVNWTAHQHIPEIMAVIRRRGLYIAAFLIINAILFVTLGSYFIKKSSTIFNETQLLVVKNSNKFIRYPAADNPLDNADLLAARNFSKKTPFILLWYNIAAVNTIQDDLPESYFSDRELNCSSMLPIYQTDPCFFTSNRDLIAVADVVLVNVHEWRYKSEWPPKTRTSKQYWTFFESESPLHLYHSEWKESQKSEQTLPRLNNVFKWTMTYRLDSTIPAPYGIFEPLAEPDFRRNYDRFANKPAGNKILYMASSYCGDRHSHRDEYVEQLLKRGLDIEMIGTCQIGGPGRASPLNEDPDCKRTAVWSTHDECTDKIGARYKFFLSFENSLCQDYVTEKFYRAASTDTIPVVFNGANMSLIAPPHSYINANDFESPRHLAAFLKKVGSNAALFNSYFWWKPFYNVIIMLEGYHYKRSLCQLCAYSHKYLANPPKSAKIIEDLDDWWMKKGNCYEGRKKWN